jgi:hypothetical protein
MENQRSRVVTHIVCSRAAFFCLLITLTNTVLAQRPSKPAGGPSLKAEMQQRGVRESVLRGTGSGVANNKIDPKRVEAAIEKVKEDFKQIQIIRNEIVRNILANKPFDYKLLVVETGEINLRAERLKTYLMPPMPEEKEKKKDVEFKNEEMKDGLVQLCNLIASFVDNPILKNPDLTDVKQSAKAGGDLLSIIDLSNNLKKSAEKLDKISK